ncbi:MAG TPA: hypothetical protein VLG92_03775 [Candidatus Saccharimonadia bacterium]|nr:hypothetical protein [Candidatus Saccharimonadia bacterium]
MEMQKHVDIVNDRIIGIIQDLRTYVDLRKDNRQHGGNKYNDNLGGGNMVMAMGLFSALGLLSKVYVVVTSSERGQFDQYFDAQHHAKDEQKIFVEFMEFISGDIGIFMSSQKSKNTYRKVWERFRDFTTHLLVPDQGNFVLTFVWDEPQQKSVEDVLKSIRADEKVVAFIKDSGSWTVNVDKLLSLLPEITTQTTGFLLRHDQACTEGCVENLNSVLWR